METKNIQISPDDFKGKSLYVGTPCFGGNARVEFVKSLFDLTHLCAQLGIPFTMNLPKDESLITRARNKIVSQYMSTEKTHLIFIDADIEFNALDVIKLLYHDKDVVCGAYPFKNLPPSYVVKPKKSSNEEVLVEVEWTGTGFMMINRNTFLKLFEKNEDLKCDLTKAHATGQIQYHPKLAAESVEIEKIKNKYYYDLFGVMIEEKDGWRNYLSEDYTFCRRWQKIGGKIYVDPSIKLNHIGTHTYEGSVEELNKVIEQNS
tara:strand:+ start:259 stop:1041 length:783 start_codon:yes stop_codon:yes gene_type:complete